MSEHDTQVEHSQILSTGIENYENLKDITTLVYLLQALFFVGFITPIIGLIINYFKRSDVKGSNLESHFRWQIKTFWWGLFWYCLASVLIFTWVLAIIGFPMLAVVTVWWVYRLVRGWLNLNKGHPMYAS